MSDREWSSEDERALNNELPPSEQDWIERLRYWSGPVWAGDSPLWPLLCEVVEAADEVAPFLPPAREWLPKTLAALRAEVEK